MDEESSTEVIILRKVDYGERDVIYTGLSPEYGRLGFMVRNGRGEYGKRKYPELELFRLVRLRFMQGKGELSYITEVEELVEDFGGVTREYEAFQCAAWISNFSVMNVMPMLGHPQYFNAVEVGLRRLCRGGEIGERVMTGICLTFAFEEGWLGNIGLDERGKSQCRQLLEMAAGLQEPNLDKECWKQQFQWCCGILLANDCKLASFN